MTVAGTRPPEAPHSAYRRESRGISAFPQPPGDQTVPSAQFIMTPEITAARPDEFLSVAALDRLAWPVQPDTYIPDGEHIWRVWCDQATLLVARLPDGQSLPETSRIAGALVMFPTQDGELFLHKMMVHPDCRGQGVGSALMRVALAGAAAPVLLTVDPGNTAAVQLYERQGFRVRERINGYYRPHEDRYIMVFTPAVSDPANARS